MPELASKEADGVIDRSETRDIPLDSLAVKGRHGVWNSRRGNHLGQRSCASAKIRPDIWTQADQTLPKSLARRGPAGTLCFDIFPPPPGDSEVISQVERLSSKEMKIAPRSVWMALGASGRSAIICMAVSRVGGRNLTLPERRSLSTSPWDLDALLPALYLRGISAGDFHEGLTALLGKDAPNLSPAVIARLKGEWEDEYQRWQKRDLSARRYVYVWADGVYLQARMEPQAECMLVLIGATPEGEKELLGFRTGMRESA